MPQTVAKINKLFADYEKLLSNDQDRKLLANDLASWTAYVKDSA